MSMCKRIIHSSATLIILWSVAIVLLGFAPGIVSAKAKAVPESEYGVYVVIMVQEPAVVYEGGIAGYPATKPRGGRKFDPNSKNARSYRKFLEKGQANALASAGISASRKLSSLTVALNGFAAKLSNQEANKIAGLQGVALVVPDELLQPTTDNSPNFLGLNDPGGAYLKGYDGEGVVVGVIDSGIWPEHPSFADDGTFDASPIGPVPCEFGNTAHHPDDVAFTCNNKLIGARQMLATYRLVIGADADEFDSTRDDNGHGTHTASTAAGNVDVAASALGIDRGLVAGIAPRAHVIAYKGLGKLGGFGSDLAAAIDQAVADGVDVINYSVGSGNFAIGPDDVAFLFAEDAGVHVATSAGNTGPGAATLGSPSSVPWLTTVGASTQDRTFQGSAVSSDGWEFFGASFTAGTPELKLVDAADAGNELCANNATLDPLVVAGNIVLCRRGAVDRAEKSLAVANAGGAGMILYNANDAQSQNTDNHHVPSVHISNTDGLAIKTYIAGAGADAVAQINGGTFTSIDAPWMASFSSRGPNRLSGDIIKPDITAPGVNVLAGASPVHNGPDVQGQLFQAIGGTSMSSPHIAGIFALLKQAHPDWSPALVRSSLMTTADQEVMKEDGATPADPFDLGGGHVDPSGKANKGSILQPGLGYDAGLFEYAGFTCGAELNIFTSGTCDFLAAIGVPIDPSDLNLPSIGVADLVGAQTITRTVTSVANDSGWRTYNVWANAPQGYEVSVSPSTFSLKSGMSRDFEVTITRTNATLGDWRFGSLTWSDETGHYDVYSPIAVRGALFSAPTDVTGSGVDGGTSFDVKFGYDGTYSAAAHGLEAAVVFSANVLQDPDQSFDPSDGFSNPHPVAVTGATHLRFAMPPEATEAGADIDLYLANPSGVIVAASTNGGTDEQIDIVSPTDGTWTLWVHGWLTPGGDSDYDLYSWVVSATPGGNMTIDSAPASASTGATGTVDVSWAGAVAGEWHLGAVSHSDGSNLLGLTLIEVDNR